MSSALSIRKEISYLGPFFCTISFINTKFFWSHYSSFTRVLSSIFINFSYCHLVIHTCIFKEYKGKTLYSESIFLWNILASEEFLVTSFTTFCMYFFCFSGSILYKGSHHVIQTPFQLQSCDKSFVLFSWNRADGITWSWFLYFY